MASLLYGAAPWLASAGYLALWFRGRSSGFFRLVALLAILFQGLSLLPSWLAADGLQFGFAHALSWMVWLAMALLWIESWAERLPPMSALLCPLAALTALLPVWFPGSPVVVGADGLFRAHVLLAMLAYTAFFLSAVHALLTLAQERALHHAAEARPVWLEMPPLLVMDRILVRAVSVGFGLLSLTLLSGLLVTQEAHGVWIRFDHKTVFTLATWAMTAVFLLGRWQWGWRGRLAARLTLIGFGLLLLAYVGSRFVLEVLLGR